MTTKRRRTVSELIKIYEAKISGTSIGTIEPYPTSYECLPFLDPMHPLPLSETYWEKSYTLNEISDVNISQNEYILPLNLNQNIKMQDFKGKHYILNQQLNINQSEEHLLPLGKDKKEFSLKKVGKHNENCVPKKSNGSDSDEFLQLSVIWNKEVKKSQKYNEDKNNDELILKAKVYEGDKKENNDTLNLKDGDICQINRGFKYFPDLYTSVNVDFITSQPTSGSQLHMFMKLKKTRVRLTIFYTIMKKYCSMQRIVKK